MADPFAIAMVAMVAGGGMMAYGTYQQGEAAEAEGRSQERLSRYNATLSDMQAEEAQKKALYESNLHRRQVRSLVGKQRAGMAAAGLELTEGSPLALLADTAVQAELDNQMILREGALNNQAFTNQGIIDRMTGKVAAARGRNAKRASLWSAGGTLLTTAGAMYGLNAAYGGGGGGAMTAEGKATVLRY